MTASSPISVQIQPAVIVEATIQMPKAIITAEINRESAVSMVSPFLQSANRCRAWTVRRA
jgi:hypothetical protein